jgi:hypothetical protein
MGKIQGPVEEFGRKYPGPNTEKAGNAESAFGFRHFLRSLIPKG